MLCCHPPPNTTCLRLSRLQVSAFGSKRVRILLLCIYPVGSCEHTIHMCSVPLQVYHGSSMDRVAAIPSLSYPDPMPAKNPVACNRLPKLVGTAAMHRDWHSVSAPRASDSLSPTTATEESTAATHSQTQSPDMQGSPSRPKPYSVCPGPPKRRLPAKSFSACTVAANSECQRLITQAVPLGPASHEDREACDMSKLISTAQPVCSTQGLLDRLKQMSGTATASPKAGINTTTTTARVYAH